MYRLVKTNSMKEIRKIIQAYESTNWENEQTAIATVVMVEGSAYRRVGARLYVSSSGRWVGGISGGCLEGDALKRAKLAIVQEKSSIVVYDTREDDAHQIGVGLGCNGRIEVMFTSIDPTDKNNPIELLKKIETTRTATALLQVIASNDNNCLGLMSTINEQENFAEKLDLPSDFFLKSIESVKENLKSEILTTPSGARILVERIRPNIRLILVGDNYDVNAFVGIGKELGWDITVAGKLQKISRHIFDQADMVLTYETVKNIEIDEFTAIVLMSHDYRKDYNLLLDFATKKIPYIGLLGPKKRTIKMQNEMQDNDIEIDLLNMSNLYSPVGLDIGAESPEEIAMSIAAEIVSVFRNRSGRSLRKREGAIH